MFEVLIQFIQQVIGLILNLDQTLLTWSQLFGPWLYLILFLIIFAETGLVVTPFLPGDSLLFAVGAICSLEGSPIDIYYLAPLLVLAALMGDNVNYFFGKWLGEKLFLDSKSRIFKRSYYDKAQEFCQKYGSKAVIIARFAPIVRTFVPFISGVGKMNYGKYFLMSFTGAILWIGSFLPAGYYFGNLPIVKRNFHIVIFGVIFLSLLPIIFEFFKARKSKSEIK